MNSRDIFVHNWHWKVASLALATLTWFAIHSMFKSEGPPVTGTYSRSFDDVPIALLTSTGSTNRYKIEPEFARVAVASSVSAREVQNLRRPDIHAFVDVTDADGERQFRRPVHIQLPMDLRVVVESYAPSNVTIERIQLPK